MVGVVGRIFTVIGLLLLFAAWIWWLYVYRSTESISCLYLPECAAPNGASHLFAVPAYEPMILWIGGATALLGSALRIAVRG